MDSSLPHMQPLSRLSSIDGTTPICPHIHTHTVLTRCVDRIDRGPGSTGGVGGVGGETRYACLEGFQRDRETARETGGRRNGGRRNGGMEGGGVEGGGVQAAAVESTTHSRSVA
eukprot:GHVU01173452.1.p1 GENE.GHVU01173452.1~~GHVU01173452.1.p1  ORF type:complete len:114 (-),score=17.76 GHVU01173452.1:80-421(-)